MAKRLISPAELDEIEGLVERCRLVQERLEALEADAAQVDAQAQGMPLLSRTADELRRELAGVLERVLARVKG